MTHPSPAIRLMVRWSYAMAAAKRHDPPRGATMRVCSKNPHGNAGLQSPDFRHLELPPEPFKKQLFLEQRDPI